MHTDLKHSNQRIAIFGGSGLLGESLIKRLLKISEIKIVILDIEPPRLFFDYDRVFYIKCDVRKVNDKKIKEYLSGVDVVFFKVGKLGNPNLSLEIESAWEFMDVNAFSLMRILPLFNSIGIKKVIVDSSITAVSDFSKSGGIIECDGPGTPSNFYGLSKAVLEDVCRVSKQLYNVNSFIIRYPRVYSKDQDNFINIFAKKIVNDEPIKLFGDIDKLIDIIHINDATELAIKCIDYEGSLDVFHAAYNTAHTRRELVDLILSESNQKQLPSEIVEGVISPREPSSVFLDAILTKQELDLNYTFSLRSIVQEALEVARIVH